jgi:hypothetical protein
LLPLKDQDKLALQFKHRRFKFLNFTFMILSLILYISNVASLFTWSVELAVNAFHSLVVAPWLIFGYYQVFLKLKQVH